MTGSEYRMLLTVHPSFLLRLPDAVEKILEYGHFVADLRLAAVTVA
jgi:uracil-DNA glycosylase